MIAIFAALASTFVLALGSLPAVAKPAQPGPGHVGQGSGSAQHGASGGRQAPPAGAQAAPASAQHGSGHGHGAVTIQHSSVKAPLASASSHRGSGGAQQGSGHGRQRSRHGRRGSGGGQLKARASASSAGMTGPAPAAATAGLGPTAAIAAAPAAATPAHGAVTPASRSARRSSHPARRSRSGHAGGPVAGGHRLPVDIPAVFEPAAVAPVAASVGTRAGESARSRAGARATHERASPLASTITKIVGVVPTPVRILIGALLALALALGVRSLLGALRTRTLERQRAELLEDVGLLQAALLPAVPARLGPVGTSAAYRPAAGPAAGGDFYDVCALDDGQVAVIVGDVSGHGREALPHTALVRYTLRAYLQAGLSPRVAVQTAGAVLERRLGGSFVTVVAATYQPRKRILVYACAGHPPPLVLGAGAIAPITACSAAPIGIGVRTGTRQTIVSLPGSSQTCFYTDGVTEARVGSELYGRRRLERALAELGPDATAATVLDRVAAETDGRPDDMATCLLRVEGGDGAPAVLIEELELDRDEAGSARTERFLLACGVDRREVAGVMRTARAGATRAGTVVLELRLAEGAPEVAVQGDDLALLHTQHAAERAVLGVSR